jgi:hypothetical protein
LRKEAKREKGREKFRKRERKEEVEKIQNENKRNFEEEIPLKQGTLTKGQGSVQMTSLY